MGQRRGVYQKHTKTGKERSCLCCGDRFLSAGPGNRMCDPCRNMDVSAWEPDGSDSSGLPYLDELVSPSNLRTL